jgi:hypothetical protein
MTDIEAKALALVNEVRSEYPNAPDYTASHIALCRAIEQHEAFKQEVSDAVEKANTPTEILCLCGRKNAVAFIRLDQFIIPKPKPDPLAGVLEEVFSVSAVSGRINAALDALGFEIRKKGQ